MNLPKEKQSGQKAMMSIDSQLPVWKIWKLMKQNNRRYLPVMEHGRLLGIIKGADVAMMSALSPGSLDLTDILDTTPLCIKITDSIQSLVSRLTSKNFEYAVLVDDFGNPLEIVSANQVLSFLNQEPAPDKTAIVNEIYEWRQNYGNY